MCSAFYPQLTALSVSFVYKLHPPRQRGTPFFIPETVSSSQSLSGNLMRQ